MNKELIEAINLLEKKTISAKMISLEAIENSLLTAYKNNYGRADNVKVNINRETGDFSIVAERGCGDRRGSDDPGKPGRGKALKQQV